MTQLGSDTTVIELGLLDAEDRDRDDPGFPTDLRRRLLIALLSLVCLLTLAASAPGRPSLGEPLWTGSVGLNGFTVGARSLYQWRTDGTAVVALDLFTGRPRWSRDITGTPDSIVDLGNGATVVTTRPPFTEGDRGPGNTITLVHDASGERFAEIPGDGYGPIVDGRMLVVFSRRFDDPVGCGAGVASCVDVTAWDVATGAVAWKVNLPPNADYLPYLVDGRVEALAELDADGAVRLRDLSTGAVTGVMTLSPEVSRSQGQIALVRDLVLTAQRGPEGVTVTAYRQPSLDRTWSVVVPDHTAMNDQGDGSLYLSECGPAVCMTVHGGRHLGNQSDHPLGRQADHLRTRRAPRRGSVRGEPVTGRAPDEPEHQADDRIHHRLGRSDRRQAHGRRPGRLVRQRRSGPDDPGEPDADPLQRD